MAMHHRYTLEEIQFVRENLQGHSYAQMARLFNKRFGLLITLKQMKRLAYKHGLRNGLGTINGYAPPNKGKTHPSWQGHYKPVGTERIDAGYVVIKTADPDVWKRKHAAIWETVNGEIPKGHVVIFADGNNRNFDIRNLLLVSRKELFVMNHLGLISANKELTKAGKTVAAIRILIAARKREREQKEEKGMTVELADEGYGILEEAIQKIEDLAWGGANGAGDARDTVSRFQQIASDARRLRQTLREVAIINPKDMAALTPPNSQAGKNF
jgi:hypothetical protein